MRNLLEYPITFDEMRQVIERLITENSYPNTGILGDITGVVLEYAWEHIQENTGRFAELWSPYE